MAALAAMLLVGLAGCGRSEPTLEQRAQRLDKQLICPVCPGESLEQSNVQIAKDMRLVIRERLSAGESEEEIKAFFVDRYGARILAEPPTSGVSLAVWVIPPAMMVVGAAALYVVVREMRRRRAATGAATPPGQEADEAAGISTDLTDRASGGQLKPYLDAVDEELRGGQAGRADV